LILKNPLRAFRKTGNGTLVARAGRQTSSPSKLLGDYEQNIGLKGDKFYSPRQL
jgi:hypothetical protein